MACSLVAFAWYYFTPEYSRVGYTPSQPVSFSHNTHAGQLGTDCRYCHTAVEKSWFAGIPVSALCMNCHKQVLSDDDRLAQVRDSAESGRPIEWTRVHRNPDYVFFSHAVHVRRGVGCVECHGQVNQMDTVTHARALSMSLCLGCHRDPAPFLRPLDQVCNLDWQPPTPSQGLAEGRVMATNWNVRASVYCSGCHR